MTEIEELLKSLQMMTEDKKQIPNNSSTWKMIRNGEWQEAGFTSEMEAQAFLENNEYANLG